MMIADMNILKKNYHDIHDKFQSFEKELETFYLDFVKKIDTDFIVIDARIQNDNSDNLDFLTVEGIKADGTIVIEDNDEMSFNEAPLRDRFYLIECLFSYHESKMEKISSKKIEIISELSENLLKDRYNGDIYIEDEEGNTTYTENAQKVFDGLYDELSAGIELKVSKDKYFLEIERNLLYSISYEEIKMGLPAHEHLEQTSNDFYLLQIL